MKNIAFVINPIAGTQNKKRLPRLIEQELDQEQWLPNIVFTEYAGQATELAQQYARMGFDAVVAVGGDGTVNEVAQGLRDTDTALGILPMGSGNGFARHIGVPLRTQRAIEMLNRSETVYADYGLANDRLFLTSCGTGFDALVAYKFAAMGSRGFTSYLKTIMHELLTYQSGTYCLSDGKDMEIRKQAFFLTFANANQWGNEAYIAPKASVQDGEMDVCILSDKALIAAPELALRLFTKSIDRSVFMDTFRTKEIWLQCEKETLFHIDGDPVMMPRDIHLRMVHDGIKIIVERRL